MGQPRETTGIDMDHIATRIIIRMTIPMVRNVTHTEKTYTTIKMTKITIMPTEVIEVTHEIADICDKIMNIGHSVVIVDKLIF